MAIGGGGLGDIPRRSGDGRHEEGRLWTPSHKLRYEGDSRGAAPVCSPFAKYIFVRPRASYSVSEFFSLRDSWHTDSNQVTTTVAAYVFFLGDSSSCGGTIIAQNQDDPMQKFLLGSGAYFVAEAIPRGGFFLLGGNQDAGTAASEISSIVFDGGLDFIVLAIHQLPGQEPEIPVVAVRHLIAALRWDWGPKKPILLMLGDNSPNVHLVREADRDSFTSNELDLTTPPLPAPTPTPLLLGGIKEQLSIATETGGTPADEQAAEVFVQDRTGDLGLNWWPIVAFVPNSSGGKDIEGSLASLKSRYYHPLLIPSGGSGCPFYTTGALGAQAVARARSLFSATTLPGSSAENVTTSAWFWEFDAVRNNSAVARWAVPRGRLTTEEANLKYLSDVNVVWESRPAWVAHPLYGQPFAMEFLLVARSPDTRINWSSASGFGNLPALFGAKERAAGWVSSMEPFLLSPTAQVFYNAGGGLMPVIPPWARVAWPWKEAENIAWPENVQEEDSTITGGPGGDHMVRRFGARVVEQEGPADYRKWSAGANAQTVVLSGTLDEGAADDLGSSAALAEKLAPFALKIQVRNVLMGPNNTEGAPVGLAYPSNMFYITPVAMPEVMKAASPNFWNVAPIGFWSNEEFANNSTPLLFDLAGKTLLSGEGLVIPASIAYPFLDDKGDFPPMMDAWDDTAQRALANHFARIDITHSRVVRSQERRISGGNYFPKPCRGVEGIQLIWPVPDDKKILITQGFSTLTPRGTHRALDIVYANDEIRGADVRAVYDGTVVFSGWFCSACGFEVQIQHVFGAAPSTQTFISRYLHLQDGSLTRSAGDAVKRGDRIGRVGSTGESTGDHLHFALVCQTLSGEYFNPCALLPPPSAGVESLGDVEGCFQDTDMAALICSAFPDGEIDTNSGRRRIRDVALAVARAESGLDTYNEGENENDSGVITSLDRGLFQINNPCHIENDLLAGNIRPQSIRTLGPSTGSYAGTECGPNPTVTPGFITVSEDYFDPVRNIQSALRISSNGRVWTAWAAYNDLSYLAHLTPTC